MTLILKLQDDFREGEERSNPHPDDFISPEEAYLHNTARTPLFSNSKVPVLTAVILILNCTRTYGASSALINEMFVLLAKVILPQVNGLPSSKYEASKMLTMLGLKYKSIHVCPNKCILFRGPDYENLDSCPKCGASRKKLVGKSLVLHRVLRHFPLISRIIRMFKSPLLAAAVMYAALHKSIDNRMRSVADSLAWSHVDETYPHFAADPRNLRFALATDGINPFSEKHSTYSIWPVLL